MQANAINSALRGHALFARIVAMVLATTMAFCACAATGETGDGQLTDFGPLAATDRYVLDLGPVSLDQAGVHTYVLKNLPAANYVLGLEIESRANAHLLDKLVVHTEVSMTMHGPNGANIISESDPLSAWTWSGPLNATTAFVYRRGSPGTYFDAVPTLTYTLDVKVARPDPDAAGLSARLVAKSAGWK